MSVEEKRVRDVYKYIVCIYNLLFNLNYTRSYVCRFYFSVRSSFPKELKFGKMREIAEDQFLRNSISKLVVKRKQI